MAAIHEHFARLTKILAPELVAELRSEYDKDAAADSKRSRAKTKARQQAQLHAHTLRSQLPATNAGGNEASDTFGENWEEPPAPALPRTWEEDG